MSASPDRGYSLKIEIIETSCIYFCSHFYKSFKDGTKIKDASILKNHTIKQALCFCSSCLDKIRKCLKPMIH